MKYIIKNRGDTMSNEISKKLSDFDYSLIQAAIEQYDQEKYDTETVDTLKNTRLTIFLQHDVLQKYISLVLEREKII